MRVAKGKRCWEEGYSGRGAAPWSSCVACARTSASPWRPTGRTPRLESGTSHSCCIRLRRRCRRPQPEVGSRHCRLHQPAPAQPHRPRWSHQHRLDSSLRSRPCHQRPTSPRRPPDRRHRPDRRPHRDLTNQRRPLGPPHRLDLTNLRHPLGLPHHRGQPSPPHQHDPRSPPSLPHQRDPRSPRRLLNHPSLPTRPSHRSHRCHRRRTRFHTGYPRT